MTIDMLHTVTREQISRLHPLTKRELMAYCNNQLAILIGHAESMVDEARSNSDLDAALVISRTARKFHTELQTLFAERKEL